VQAPRLLASLFGELDLTELDRLTSMMTLHRFRCADHVISAHRGRRDVVVLVEGRLRVCSVSSAGREVTLHRHCSGSILGLTNLISAAPPEVDAFAESDGTLLCAPAQDIAGLITVRPHLSLLLLREAIRQLQDVEEFARRLSDSSVERRVAAALLEAPIPPQGAPLLREHLASRAAASRESVSRALQRLAAQGVIELLGRRVRLCDRDALRTLACPNDRVPCFGGTAEERLSPGTCRCPTPGS
jgi:CRP-like cAMP-binding protein